MVTMKITANGGPLDGKSFILPSGTDDLTHHAVTGGTYIIHLGVATWEPETKPTPATTRPSKHVDAQETTKPQRHPLGASTPHQT